MTQSNAQYQETKLNFSGSSLLEFVLCSFPVAKQSAQTGFWDIFMLSKCSLKTILSLKRRPSQATLYEESGQTYPRELCKCYQCIQKLVSWAITAWMSLVGLV